MKNGVLCPRCSHKETRRRVSNSIPGNGSTAANGMGRDARDGEHHERSFAPANLRERVSSRMTFLVLKRVPKEVEQDGNSCQSSC